MTDPSTVDIGVTVDRGVSLGAWVINGRDRFALVYDGIPGVGKIIGEMTATIERGVGMKRTFSLCYDDNLGNHEVDTCVSETDLEKKAAQFLTEHDLMPSLTDSYRPPDHNLQSLVVTQ